MGPKAKGAEYITIGGSAELRSPSDPPTCGLVGPYFYPATPSYPYIFLFYVINIKRKRDGGVVAVFLEQKKVGSPSSYPLYIFILCNKYKKKAGRRGGGGRRK